MSTLPADSALPVPSGRPHGPLEAVGKRPGVGGDEVVAPRAGAAGGALGRPDQTFCPVRASWHGLCGPPSGLFSLALILTLSLPPAGQLAWSSEPGRVPWPHTGPSGCW